MPNFINKIFANQDSPKVTSEWKKHTNETRVKLILSELAKEKLYEKFSVLKADSGGQVVLKIEQTIAANERGILLLNLEKKLKKNIDPGITLWLEPIGDKSKLRNLRGISFKEI
jgi:hypothetical protein